MGGGVTISPSRGMLVLVDLDPVSGHEQRGLRPCIVVSHPQAVACQRFPLLAVVPVTGTFLQGILYPRLIPSNGGLSKVSYALTDNVRAIDFGRIRRVFKHITQAELAAVDRGLEYYFGFSCTRSP